MHEIPVKVSQNKRKLHYTLKIFQRLILSITIKHSIT